MNKFTESKIFRKAKSAFDIAAVVSFIFWMPIIIIALGTFFFWK